MKLVIANVFSVMKVRRKFFVHNLIMIIYRKSGDQKWLSQFIFHCWSGCWSFCYFLCSNTYPLLLVKLVHGSRGATASNIFVLCRLRQDIGSGATFMRYTGILFKSEAIDTDQSVALIVAKVTIDTDRWQVCKC